jgi:hypothetical protein
MTEKSLWYKLFIFFILLGIVYLAGNLTIFKLFAPFKTTMGGLKITYTSLDNPVKISFILFLIGIFFRYLDYKYGGGSALSPYSLVVVVFSFVFIFHLSSGVVTPYDSKHTVPTAWRILSEGKINLDKYKAFINPTDHGVENLNGHIYNFFPIGTPLLAIPFLLLYNDALVTTAYLNSSGEIERFIASFIVALSSIFIYLICLQLLKNKKYALILVLIYAFCTSVWSTASRALWQHGPSLLMLTISLYLILSAKKKPFLIQYLSLPLIFSYIIRPTNSISVFFLTLYVAFRYRAYLLRYLFWGGILTIGFFSLNYSIYHSLLPPYFLPGRVAANPLFAQALLGNLFSPARGLFIFSPILLFSLIGFWYKARFHTIEALDYFLVTIVILHWITISSFTHWWGGWSFGPRFFTDMVPYFIYFMVPIVGGMADLKGKNRLVVAVIFFILLGFSFLVHYRGANSMATIEWNYIPDNVDLNPSRIWDWSDLQFFRGRNN